MEDRFTRVAFCFLCS